MTLRKEWDLATDPQFSERVSMALYHIAREVLDEPAETWGHPLRRNFASAVIGQEAENFARYAALVITDPAITALFEANPNAGNSDVEDQQIEDAVRRMWNAIVSVTPKPPEPQP